jgi:3-deoxy-D-manno-octulosonic-acid transferase
MGDTRYDQVAYRLKNLRPIKVLKPVGTPCLIAGSTWSEDEAVLLEALEDLLKSNQLKLVLVPHEPAPEHIKEISQRLERKGLTFQIWSETQTFNSQVLLVDQVGVLAELYTWGTWAFIGGSFRKSVHSVMEALGANCVTFVGPKHLNNREALQFKDLDVYKDWPGLFVVTDARALKAELERQLASPEETQHYREALRREFESRLGATLKLTAAVAPSRPADGSHRTRAKDDSPL